jgi:hypothetical protein
MYDMIDFPYLKAEGTMNETAIPKVTNALEVHMVYSSLFFFFFPVAAFGLM